LSEAVSEEAKARAAQIDRKARLKLPPQKFPKQDPAVRIHNWNEVKLPIDREAAKLEAARCIQCPAAPCQKACPVHNDIPTAFWRLEHDDLIGGALKFFETSNLPDMCGRLCPQERLCEGHCVVGKNALPVQIGRLEAFLADNLRETRGYPLPDSIVPTGKRVAVVGAGPAGLAVAEQLAKNGHGVTIFDGWPRPGGVLRYGIPNFKMEKGILDKKVAFLQDRLGVQFVQNVWIGRDRSLDDLAKEFDAVFLGHGAGVGNRVGVPGEDLPGVITATEFLVRGNLTPGELPPHLREPLHIGRRLVVIGGGDTSMDCVRTAVRLGAEEVVCVYRRTEAEMPGRAEERMHAREEGVRFEWLTAPLRFLAGDDGRLTGVEFQRMELGEPDESGRRRPVPIPGSEFVEPADTAVIAIGYSGDPKVAGPDSGVQVNRWGLIVVDEETGQTTRPGVYAGGDCVNGPDLVVTALAGGRKAAAAIHRYLTGESTS